MAWPNLSPAELSALVATAPPNTATIWATHEPGPMDPYGVIWGSAPVGQEPSTSNIVWTTTYPGTPQTGYYGVIWGS
jgi:hypothetical protein